MLLTISTTHAPATDLGYLLGKNPGRFQTFDVPQGHAHVFYPEASSERCTVALLLEIDPIALVRPPRGGTGFALAQYTNDRPYASSSYLSVAIAKVFGSALNGRSQERPELVSTELPLEAELSAVACRRGNEGYLRRLFEPLGYDVEVEPIPLDPVFTEWGPSCYFSVRLAGNQRLSHLLRHLYVLIPVLDADKHYWVDEDELEKLLRHGEGWLDQHPAKEEIAYRYLREQRPLTREALRRIADLNPEEPPLETRLEARLSLNELRLEAVVNALLERGARSVVDLGCGEGRLLKKLLAEASFTRILGLDVSCAALERAVSRLRLSDLPERQRRRIELAQGALTYRDERLAGFEAAVATEVVEHFDASRLGAFERVLFEVARPTTVVLTTPNREFNVRFDGLAANQLRHRDHRFEWTRTEFQTWAEGVAERHRYTVRFVPVGEVDPQLGPPTQMGVFLRED